jgi:hypothetical protein
MKHQMDTALLNHKQEFSHLNPFIKQPEILRVDYTMTDMSIKKVSSSLQQRTGIISNYHFQVIIVEAGPSGIILSLLLAI